MLIFRVARLVNPGIFGKVWASKVFCTNSKLSVYRVALKDSRLREEQGRGPIGSWEHTPSHTAADEDIGRGVTTSKGPHKDRMGTRPLVGPAAAVGQVASTT